MATEIVILGRTIPVYGLLVVGGTLLGLLYALLSAKRLGLSRDDCAYIYVFGAIGAVIGAKVLYLLTVLPELTAQIGKVPFLQLAGQYLTGGLVFYGGLLGALLGTRLSAKAYRVDWYAAMAVLIPGLCLAHATGRVGCHLMGCCHGVAVQGTFAVTYTHSAFAPNGVPLLPVQLMEAAFLLLLFAFLAWYSRRTPHKHRVLGLYLLLYALFRFALEFFRGDANRGILAGLSVSQWISIVILLALAVSALRRANARRSAAK